MRKSNPSPCKSFPNIGQGYYEDESIHEIECIERKHYWLLWYSLTGDHTTSKFLFFSERVIKRDIKDLISIFATEEFSG